MNDTIYQKGKPVLRVKKGRCSIPA